MKRIISLILIIASLVMLASCGGEKEYEPIASTEEEAQIVFTIKIDEKTYDVKYELYRTFFLNLKRTVDGGNADAWVGDEKNEYVKKIDELVLAQITDVYSVLHEAERVGINPYSAEFDENVKKYVKSDVEAFGGSYADYLNSLKAANTNYSVQDLLIRYSLAYDKLNYYYTGYVANAATGELAGEHLEYTQNDVFDFYYSDECVRVLRAFLPLSTNTNPEELRLSMIAAVKDGDDAVRESFAGKSSTPIYEVENGTVIGRLSLDSAYYAEYTDAAFALGDSEVGKVIRIDSDTESGYAILYKISKTNQHFYDCYDNIRDVYKQNEIGKILSTCAEKMKSGATQSDFLKSLDRASISMK